MRQTRGLANPELVETVISRSNETIRWLTGRGVQWSPFTTFAIREGGKTKWPPGQTVMGARNGGIGLSDTLFQVIEKQGAEIKYGTRAIKLLVDSKGRVCGVTAKGPDGIQDIPAKAVILGCGGFEANREMRARYLGKLWEMARIRGTRYNVGLGLTMAMEVGAQPSGHWSCCHGALIDANAAYLPDRDVGDATNRSSTCFGILVNVNGKRFLDEGEDLRTYTYARFGEAAIGQPDSAAFQIFDSKVQHLLEDRYATSTPVTADTPEELARTLEIPGLADTIKEFNAAVKDGAFDPLRKDGKSTAGIQPAKSNWAQRIDTPPLMAYPVTGGIAFTYGGIKVNSSAEVLDFEDKAIPGLYAVGEIVGGLFYYAYMGGAGLVSGAVFGGAAGEAVATL